MDRQSTFLLALGMLIAAALAVSVSGWALYLRDRRLHKAALAVSSPVAGSPEHHEAPEES